MEINEYRPRGGWNALRRKSAKIQKVKNVFSALVAFAIYAAASSVCNGL